MAFTAAALLASCGNNAEETTTPAEGVENHEGHEGEGEDHTGHDHASMDENKTEFGAVAVNKEEAMTTEELLAKFEGQTEMAATFKGELTGVCTKMGCWVKVKNPTEGADDFMVRFVDHFTIPTSTEMGTVAYLTGTAKQDTTSVDDQIHLLEDGGMTHEEAAKEVTGPKYGMTFYADGIALETATEEAAPATETM